MHVDVGNVSASVLTGTTTSLDRSQDWLRSFTFRFTPMIVSDLPNHRDPDEVRPATVAADANSPHRCKKKMRRLFPGLVDPLTFPAVDLLDAAIEWLANELGVAQTATATTTSVRDADQRERKTDTADKPEKFFAVDWGPIRRGGREHQLLLASFAWALRCASPLRLSGLANSRRFVQPRGVATACGCFGQAIRMQ